MNHIPCKQNKCLLYPACISRSHIYCYKLYNYFDSLTQTTPSKGHQWDLIHLTLKRVTMIYPYDKEIKDPFVALLASQQNPIHLYDTEI
jgi:hypothetical protein